MNKIPVSLLIYINDPGEMSMYFIPDSVITAEFREYLRSAHGRMVNNDEMNDGMYFLCDALLQKKDFDFATKLAHACIFHPYKYDQAEHKDYGFMMKFMLEHTITHIYFSGFFL